ncbi:MAG: hypothetical protein JRF43_01145 [Deltaproteobacteria bacterium]|nr:hypothetical protein [Deltaproteobacteria bacterium]RLF42463.1 MAG: hypothetical protein DRN17_07820 [Thermoplasmata archaeon]
MKAQTVIVPQRSSYERPRENFEHIVGYLDSREAGAMSHSELERELEKRGRKLMRILFGCRTQPAHSISGILKRNVKLR